MMDLVPTARVAHIGLYREPVSFAAVEYFFKSPSDLGERLAIVVMPVVATANTSVAAVDRLKERGAKDIRLVCLIAAPAGLERVRGLHPDVAVWTSADGTSWKSARSSDLNGSGVWRIDALAPSGSGVTGIGTIITPQSQQTVTFTLPAR